jgi:hypothetical protein
LHVGQPQVSHDTAFSAIFGRFDNRVANESQRRIGNREVDYAGDGALYEALVIVRVD